MTMNICITRKRRWSANGFEHMECYCNEQRVATRWKGSDETDAIEGIKNTCKLIKCFGDPCYKMGHISSEEYEKVAKMELPEWNTG